ncbi:MAG: hypothetical protein MJ094_03550 [Saccharofermentans sp.]|nr:hypothetical protein [Saccharofermentans sp.]
MKKHTDNITPSGNQIRSIQITPSRTPAKAPAKQTVKTPAKKKRKKKKQLHVYVAILMDWLIAVTGGIMYIYKKFNDYLVSYEASYQASRPSHVIDEIFTHFENYDIDYIWEHMDSHPATSQFESEETVRNYILEMINGKAMTYKPSNTYTEESPSYVIEADGLIVAEVKLAKDLMAPQRDYGFPTWTLASISYYTEPFESVMITAAENSTVYVNGILLDDFYVASDITYPSDISYVEPYNTMPGTHTYYIADLYAEPEVVVRDLFGNEIPVTYDSARDIYESTYTSENPERAELEELAIEFTSLFANVISKDANIEDLRPYFAPNSVTFDAVSRNTALQFFTTHGAVTINNQEILEFITYSEDVVYIECYIEQWMQMGWGGAEPEVVPTNARIYFVRIDGVWKVASMRF